IAPRARTAAVHQGADAHVLGDRDVVDPHARDPRRLAAHLPAVFPSIRSAVLGCGVSAGPVHRVHVPALASDRRAAAVADSARVRLYRARGVDTRIRWTAARPRRAGSLERIPFVGSGPVWQSRAPIDLLLLARTSVAELRRLSALKE